MAPSVSAAPEPLAFQPPFPGMGPPECPPGEHRFLGRGRWRGCASCWLRGWFPLLRR